MNDQNAVRDWGVNQKFTFVGARSRGRAREALEAWAEIPSTPLPQTYSSPMPTLHVDVRQVDAAQAALLRTLNQYEWVLARAMTNAAKEAKGAVQREILPLIQGGPTPWTRRGLIATFANPQRLEVFVGFQHGGGSGVDLGAFKPKGVGVPAGRYMDLGAGGGPRRPKSTEERLRRAGVLRDDRFLTPGPGVRRDARGNVSGGTYQQMLSRLRAMGAEGSGQDAPRGPGSRGRSAGKRRERDYFAIRSLGRTPSRWEPGADVRSIAVRVGPGPQGGTGRGSGNPGRPQTVGYRRGYSVAFNVVKQPRYEARFPVHDVINRSFRDQFPIVFQRAFDAEIEQQRRRGRL